MSEPESSSSNHKPHLPVGKVTFDDILTARARLAAYLTLTPMHYADRLQIMLKLENLQKTGSYKVRGALNALLACRERGEERPIICASAGNHAQGVAWAAQQLGMQAITVMPLGTPTIKVSGVARWGAQIHQHGSSYDESYHYAQQLASERNYCFLSAFDNVDVIAGQGTIGLEISDYQPDVVVVPIGGGGLATGIAIALQAQGARIVGAQVDGVDAMARLFRGQQPQVRAKPTLADGIRVTTPGVLTRDLCCQMLEDIIVVSELDIQQAIIRLIEQEHVVAEGAGVVALAAAEHVQGQRKCVVISGGNIDSLVLAQLITQAHTASPTETKRQTCDAL